LTFCKLRYNNRYVRDSSFNYDAGVFFHFLQKEEISANGRSGVKLRKKRGLLLDFGHHPSDGQRQACFEWLQLQKEIEAAKLVDPRYIVALPHYTLRQLQEAFPFLVPFTTSS
jgi:hypothetical protein